MLIDSPRLTSRDREAWARAEAIDAVNAQRARLRAKAKAARETITTFAADGPCYLGVSWGKDSTVIAHLAVEIARVGGPRIPIAWVRREPIDNPDCHLVRDAFAARFPDADLHEIRVDCECDPTRPEQWWTAGRPGRAVSDQPKQVGFALAAARFGRRYISGVRAAESGIRELRMAKHGIVSANTCAPIGRWSTAEVFAYLHLHDLPIHPAYAMTLGGLLDRDRLRVGSIGGPHGRGHGRLEWERRYYPEIVAITVRP